MKQLSRIGTGSFVAAAAGVIVMVAGGPAFASTAAQLPVDAVGSQSGLGDVVPVSATDGWAVGGDGNGLIERFNGTRWSVVASPDLLDHRHPNNFAGLSGVDATSATNAFAVGSTTAFNAGGASAVALRWNGTAWNRSTVATPSGATSSLRDVKAFSASDAWAVGTTGSSALGQNLIMHYTGTTWTQVPAPSPGTRDNLLTSVAGSGPNDVWAVGYFRNLPYGNRIRLPQILHWNGSAWSQVTSPDSGAGHSTYLYGVAVTSATDAWAVGNGDGGAFVARWNGTAWISVPAPALTTLSTVSARSAGDVWVAGADASGAPALAHWNGASWSLTTVTVTGGTGLPALSSVAVAPGGTEWAVGSRWDGTTGNSTPLAYRVTG